MSTIKPAGKIVGKILLVLGILAALYFFVAKPAMNKKKSVPIEIKNDSVTNKADSVQNLRHDPVQQVIQPKKQPTKPVVKPEPKKETPKKKKGERENLDINF